MSACLTWALRRGARALWLSALLLATGCATVPTPPGSEEAYLQRAHRREFALRWGWGPVPQTQRERPEAEHEPVPTSGSRYQALRNFLEELSR